MAGVDHPIDDPEELRTIMRREGIDYVVEECGVGHAQLRDGVRVRHTRRTSSRNHLTQEGQGVTHASAARTRNEGECRRLRVDSLLGADPGEVLLEDFRGNESEGVVVGA
jgi:hypothetical protein